MSLVYHFLEHGVHTINNRDLQKVALTPFVVTKPFAQMNVIKNMIVPVGKKTHHTLASQDNKSEVTS